MGFLTNLFNGGGLKRYKILHPLGKGSMSNVFTAVAPDSTVVALKISKIEVQKIIKRLNKDYRSGQTEGSIGMDLSHHNIVRTYACGTCPEGEWIAMELMNGQILAEDMIKVSRIIREGDCKLFFAVGAALQHMHDKGYIHRDISPKNIFLLDDGQVKLFDFSLTITEEMSQLKAGNRTGSPSYMAPELIRRSKTNHRVDIYAFGIVMYEILCGRRPVSGKGTMEKMMNLLNVEMVPLHELRDDVNPKLEEIVMKATARNVNERYTNMTDLLDDLERSGAEGRAEAAADLNSLPPPKAQV